MRFPRPLPEGSNICGCATCGRVFSSLTAFDHHRNTPRGVERACQDPAEVGLVYRPGRKLWSFPSPERPLAHHTKVIA